MNNKHYFLSIILAFVVLPSLADSDNLTNPVSITKSLTFRLENRSADGRGAFQLEFPSDQTIHRVLSTPLTNHVHFRELPTPETFEFEMSDLDGRPLTKTKRGLEWSRPLPEIKSARDFFRCKPRSVVGDDIRELFRPDEMFDITNKGTFVLEVRIRLLVPLTHGQPDAKAMNNPELTDAVPEHEVFVSAPVRIKVIKK